MRSKSYKFLLLVVCVAVMLTGVSIASIAQDSNSECEMDWNPTFPEFDAYDPPIQIDTPFPGAVTFIGDDDFTDNPMYNRVVDQLGIEYTIAWQSDDNTQLQNAIASGNLPEMFAAGGTGGDAIAQLGLLIDNGAVADITDIWEEEASPLTQELKGYPDADMWVSMTRDDRIYGIAFTYGPAYNIDNLGFIRQDWLDQLGLPMPTTIEELETTMQAFVDAGLSTYGINANRALVTWYMSLDHIFGAYGSMPRTWIENEDGTLEYGSIQSENGEALALLARWYDEGLIDPDFFTYGQGDSASLVLSEDVGVWFAPWWGAGVVGQLTDAVEGAEVSLLPPIAGPDGDSGRKGSATTGASVMFRADVDENVIRAAIRQLNWQIEMHHNWEEYQQYGEWRNSHAFAEGYEWIFDEDCNVVAGPVSNSYVYTNEVGMGFPFITYPSYQANIFADMAEWLTVDESELNSAQQFLISNPQVVREVQYYNNAVDTIDEAYIDPFLGASSERMTDLLPDVFALEEQYYLEIITGQRSVDDFEEFVQEWLDTGGAEITEDVNAWYAAQNN